MITWPAVSQICALIVLPSTCKAATPLSTVDSIPRLLGFDEQRWSNCRPKHLGSALPPLLTALCSLHAFQPSTHQLFHTPLCSTACTCMLRVANSTPMVDLLSSENSLRVKRDSRLDLPTPESPISTTLKR